MRRVVVLPDKGNLFIEEVVYGNPAIPCNAPGQTVEKVVLSRTCAKVFLHEPKPTFLAAFMGGVVLELDN
jgi:hypothetical protein